MPTNRRPKPRATTAIAAKPGTAARKPAAKKPARTAPATKSRAREATRCFALMAEGDTTIATCRFRTQSRKGQPVGVSFDKGASYRQAQMAAAVPVGGGVSVEVWQCDAFGLDTPHKSVWNVPLLQPLMMHTLLLYPVVFRVVAPPGALPTVSRTRKLLAERLAARGAVDLDERTIATEPSPDATDYQSEDDVSDDAASTVGLSDDSEEEEEEEEEEEDSDDGPTDDEDDDDDIDDDDDLDDV